MSGVDKTSGKVQCKSVDAFMLKQFHPFDLLADEYLELLAEQVDVIEIAKGDYLFSTPRNPLQNYYLLSGKIDIQCRMEHVIVDCSDPKCYYPIEDSLQPEASAKALCHCQVLRCNHDFIDKYLSWSQSAEYGSVDVGLHDASEPVNEHEWMDSLAESALMQNLSASEMFLLFSKLEEVKCQKGEKILQKGQISNYFYVLKKGLVEVVLAKQGKSNIRLQPGDYFGEEAMVAETASPVDIMMMTDGLLARLDHAEFDHILRHSAVLHAKQQQVQAFMDNMTACVVLDVRLQAEFQHSHCEQSRNIPINQLRNKLASLDHNKLYLVAPEGGRRSEMAAYMLRQAGFDAYLLDSDQTPTLAHAG